MLLKETYCLRLSAGGIPSREDAGVLEAGVPLLERSAALGSQLRHLANNELGVTHMQVQPHHLDLCTVCCVCREGLWEIFVF